MGSEKRNEEGGRAFLDHDPVDYRADRAQPQSFVAEARERGEEDPDFPELYKALAEFADWHLEVKRRRRTGKGIWYAIVEINSHADDGIYTAIQRHHRRCEGKKKAIVAVREMLAEHINKFDDGISIEPELMTDLKWDRRAYDEA
ncbi:hypothetical protein [Tianweitania sediminis]|uniref:Uncharacterized protein n=1 Tax=Tianweitania sediminis TaxID=1502156 RepID=A0A8J7RSG0_9HYPH|nr:hypothetical protein [Tianweitania sediminis]MBP0441189.1 hypothetical protein [Tianweitania sediminis]